MNGDDTSLTDHHDLSRKLLNDVEAFIDEIGVRGCTSHLEQVTHRDKLLKGRKLGQQPERFVEDNLVFPVLRSLDHSIRPRPKQYAPRWNLGRDIPDFCLTTIPPETAKDQDIRLFGEVKSPNKLHYAREDIREYLAKDLDFHAVTVLTDGIQWELWLRPKEQPLEDDDTPYRSASLREALGSAKARNLHDESYHPHHVRGLIDHDDFSQFTPRLMRDTIQKEFGVDVG